MNAKHGCLDPSDPIQVRFLVLRLFLLGKKEKWKKNNQKHARKNTVHRKLQKVAFTVSNILIWHIYHPSKERLSGALGSCLAIWKPIDRGLSFLKNRKVALLVEIQV
jgi:hypothetical protein